MINRLGSYLASKPRRAAVLFLTLSMAFILVFAGLVLELSHFGRAPYPSQELGLSLVDGNVLFSKEYTTHWFNETSNATEPINPYAGADFAFGIVGSGWGTHAFGDDPQLSANTGAPSSMNLSLFVSPSISAELTDSTSNGAFDRGDSILFRIEPLQEDTVFFMAFAFFPRGDSPSAYTEMSFAIHDGKLYSWLSDNLPTQDPWWEPWWDR